MSPRKLAKDVLPGAVEKALDEQASAAWRLHALVQCVGASFETTGPPVGNLEAAVDGLAELAEQLSSALDPDTFAQRVAEIEAEDAREAAEEAAERAHPGRRRRMLLGEPEPPRNGLRVVKGTEPGEAS